MKRLLMSLLLIASSVSYGSTNQDQIDDIQNVIESVETSVDSYHCGRLKGYLEGLRLEKGYSLSVSEESTCRMNLVAIKKMINTVTQRYPEVKLNDIFKKLSVVNTGNSHGKCMIYNKAEELADDYKHYGQNFEFAIKDWTGEKFTEYSLPIIRKCISSLTTLAEKEVVDFKVE